MIPKTNNNRNRIWNLTGFLFCILPATMQAAIGLNLSAWIIQDDNAFHNYENVQDLIVQPHAVLTWTQGWNSGAVSFYYEGAFSHFQEMDARQYQLHYGGFSLSQKLRGGSAQWTVGAKTGSRINQNDYAYYNYRHLHLFSNYRYFLSGWGLLLGGLQMQQRQYKNIPQFDYREIRLFVQQNVFLPSKTTLIGRFHIAHKKYLESKVSETVIQQLVQRNDQPGEGDTPGSGRGSNQGKGQGGGKQAGDNPVEPESDPELETVEQTVRVELPGSEVMQWIASLRAAQSLGRYTGMAVECVFQRRIDGEGRSLNYQDSGYEEDDPLFDDPYNYESDTWSLELTQKLPWKLLMKLGGNSIRKEYPYPAFDLNGKLLSDGALRQDDLTQVWIQMSRRFNGLGIIRQLEFFFGFSSIRNRSNDAYFNYENMLTSLGWQLSF